MNRLNCKNKKLYKQRCYSVLSERINAIVIFVILLFLIKIDLHVYTQQQKYDDSFFIFQAYGLSNL